MTSGVERLLGLGGWREQVASHDGANRRNLLLLIQLRWLAAAGQVATILIVHYAMKIPLPLFWLLAAPAALAVLNLVSAPVVARRQGVSDRELMLALVFDVAALTWQLYLTGGPANPFVSLYLLQVVLGAVMLAPAYAWALIAATSLCFAALGLHNQPLALPPTREDALLSLYLQGSLISFVLMAVLLVLVTGFLMFLAFGSIVLPIKAALMSALGLGATLGILTWIFVDGHGAELANFTPGPLFAAVLVLIIAFAAIYFTAEIPEPEVSQKATIVE